MDINTYIKDHYPDDELISIDGFDEAFVGVGTKFNMSIICYDRSKIINILMGRDHMTLEDAEDYILFNIEGAYMGEKTPVIINIVRSDEREGN